MQISKDELAEIIEVVVDATIRKLGRKGLLAKANANTAGVPKEKSAYQQTESLLFNYNNFKKVILEKEKEIEDLRTYGVPERGSAVVKCGGNCGGKPRGLVLDEERVEDAVWRVRKSMEDTVHAIAFIDRGMEALSLDPYYKILEMRYFEGRTQEDIAVEFGCSQQNIAYHKNRLIRELAIKLFPDKVVNEHMN